MKAIASFLRPLQKDSDVANLQEGLLLLLCQPILKLPREEWLRLQDGVTKEQAQQVYHPDNH